MAKESENWDSKIKVTRQLFALTELPRDPLKFEPFGLLGEMGLRERISIRDGKLHDAFLARAQASVQRGLSDDAFMYGHLAQNMFEALVVSLGQVKLIKQEDAGSVYADDQNLKIPDFRIVLADDSRLLVEVKNFYQKDGLEEFSLAESYLAGLQRYADLDGSLLAIATYWVRWNLWTLVPASRIHVKDGSGTISLGEALKANCSAALGDLSIGARPPIRRVLRFQPSKPVSISDDQSTSQYVIKIEAVEIYSDDVLLTDKTETNIAAFLCDYGRWKEQEPVTLMDGELLIGGEFRWQPQEEEEETDQGFNMVGSLSSMFSKWFRERALGKDGKPIHAKISVTPGFLGILIPDGYKGKGLPLWILVQSPNFENKNEG